MASAVRDARVLLVWACMCACTCVFTRVRVCTSAKELANNTRKGTQSTNYPRNVFINNFCSNDSATGPRECKIDIFTSRRIYLFLAGVCKFSIPFAVY